jgi:acetyltransferase-like isoleucine patch superfamily enzyme
MTLSGRPAIGRKLAPAGWHNAEPLLRSIGQRLLYSGDRVRRYGPGALLMSTLRRWRLLLLHRHADVRFLGPVYIGPGTWLHIPSSGTLIVGPNVEFRRGLQVEIEGSGRIEIGAGCRFTYDVLILCTTSIRIGDRTGVGQSVLIVDGQHRYRDLTRPMWEQGSDFRPIEIGADVSIGSKCTIMADVGTRTFVGANSVVSRDVPPYSLAIGAPARVVDRFGP